MAKPWIHAQSSAKKFGGDPEDYMEIHTFMDSSKAVIADNRHRALTHNSWFISQIMPRIFGETFRRKSDSVIISTRDICEQHILEDFGKKFIPSAADYLEQMEFKDWMQNGMTTPPSYEKLKKKEEKISNRPKRQIIPFNPGLATFD